MCHAILDMISRSLRKQATSSGVVGGRWGCFSLTQKDRCGAGDETIWFRARVVTFVMRAMGAISQSANEAYKRWKGIRSAIATLEVRTWWELESERYPGENGTSDGGVYGDQLSAVDNLIKTVGGFQFAPQLIRLPLVFLSTTVYLIWESISFSLDSE